VLTRRELLAFGTALPLLRAQAYRSYSSCLPDYLRGLAQETYVRRNQALAALQTPAAVHERQRWARETFWKLAGGMPARTELNVTTTGAFERPGYRLEKLYYESQPGLYVSANLYVPLNRTPPFPGVLFQMGHSLIGKAAAPYQKCCQGLARLGYLVLAFDPAGQGERIMYPSLPSVDDEHTIDGKLLLLSGGTATALQTWDAIRSLDVLAAHPQVDKTRLASTGQSGGGTLTMFLAATDDRLSCAAVSSGNTENLACADFEPPGSTDDAEQDFVGGGPAGFGRWDTLYPMAPKPLLILVSAKDWFGTYSPNYLKNGREEFAKLRKVYQVLGAEDKLEWGETPLPHALSLDMRLKVYRFFERTLKGSDRPVTEPEVAPETESVLKVGLPKGKTPRVLARERARALKPDGQLPAIPTRSAAAPTILGRAAGEDCEIQAVEVASESGVWLPGWIFVPKKKGATVLAAFDSSGRNSKWQEGNVYQQLAAAGVTVCAFDVRGIGDLTPPPGRNSDDEGYSWASLILGRPLALQRAADMLAVARAVHPLGQRLVVAARNQLAVPALFAAQADSGIDAVYLASGLPSFASLLEDNVPPYLLSAWVPGVLAHTDLPQLRAELGSRCREGTGWDLAALQNL
jgi:dienelactone hydrolase